MLDRVDDVPQGIAGLLRRASGQHGTFSRRQAAASGVSAKQLRRLRDAGDIKSHGPSVFVLPHGFDKTLQRMKASTLAFPASAVTGRSAAAIHGLGDWSEFDSVDLWLPQSARNAKNVPDTNVVRNTAIQKRFDLLEVDRIPTVSAAATLIQLGSVASPDELRLALDDFERSYSSEWLAQTIDRMHSPGRSGTTQLLGALNSPNRVTGVTESWMERVLADLASRPGVPPVELQCEVVVDTKRYRIDVGVPLLRLGFEGHSRQHHFGAFKEDADNVRDHDLASAGWLILYITWSQLQRPSAFVDLFERTVRQRAKDLGIRLAA